MNLFRPESGPAQWRIFCVLKVQSACAPHLYANEEIELPFRAISAEMDRAPTDFLMDPKTRGAEKETFPHLLANATSPINHSRLRGAPAR